MATMKSVKTGAQNHIDLVDVERPAPGPKDVLVKIRACGICGTDTFFLHLGGMPAGADGTMRSIPLGHEPAGEIAEVGAEVTDLKVGDRVVVNPQGVPSGIIGCGGEHGAMSEYLLLEEAEIGRTVAVFPDTVPFDVASLNEPMAVARHAVNRTRPRSGDKVVVFGAGPIGLGAAIAYKLVGAHVVVVDIVAGRLEKALLVGADAVVDSAAENVAERLIELHGRAPASLVRGDRAATDIYLDAAGAPAVIRTVTGIARQGATLGVVALHKEPVELDLGALLTTELTVVLSAGYPTEIFEVTRSIAADWERYAHIVSDTVPFAEVERALTLAATPGASEKVVVTFA